MCIFTGRVADVSGTAIFARPIREGRQILVYSMNLATSAEVAMVLPLPTPPGPSEDVVRFIDLSAWPHFFEEIDRAFRRPSPPKGFATLQTYSRRLVVHEVGSFEASFVPTRRDFSRLDPRFRLADDVWEALPDYDDWGFSVFKLGPMSRRTGVHPMALEFPRRQPDHVFFPTVHVHHGSVEPWAIFDHWLYCQDVDEARLDRWCWSFQSERRWNTSPVALSEVIVERVGDIVRPDLPCHRVALRGSYPNKDVVI